MHNHYGEVKSMRYFITFLVALGLLALVIVLLFSGGGNKSTLSQQLTSQSLPGYYTTDAVAIMTIDGPVNDTQDHRAIRVTVGRDNVTFEELQGYSGNVIKTQQYPNDPDAYAVFLLSLARSGFTLGDNNPKLRDERGFCPLGDRYIFQFTQDNHDLQRYWTTNCNGPKTYKGPLAMTLRLFQLQVPNYSDLTKDVSGF